MKGYLKDIQSDVDEMNKSLDHSSLSTEAPATETAATEVPGTDAPATESPATEVPGTESPATEAPTTEVPDERDETIKELRARIDKLEGDKKPVTEVPTTEAPPQFDAQSFVSEDDLDDLTRDPAKLNTVFNNIYQKAVVDSRRILGEKVLRSIPDIVKNNIIMMTNLREASEKFYNENEDLKPFKRVVAAVFEELASESPDKHYNEVIEDVGPEVRKRLNLQKQTTPNPNNKDGHPPRLPRKRGKPGRTTEKPSLTGIEAEIAAMNETLSK